MGTPTLRELPTHITSQSPRDRISPAITLHRMPMSGSSPSSAALGRLLTLHISTRQAAIRFRSAPSLWTHQASLISPVQLKVMAHSPSLPPAFATPQLTALPAATILHP